MTITIDYGLTDVINIPRNDMTLIQSSPTEIRQLDLNDFRLQLRDIEDSQDGVIFARTHNHNTTLTVGGVTLARSIEILEPYTITFEDGQYAVNLVGANSNVGDRVNVNQVSVRSANSAGLVDLEVLMASAYRGHVVINPTTGEDGVSTPIGTFKIPSKNLNDALTIATSQGIRSFTFLESMTLVDEDFSLGYNFKGVSPYVILTAENAANLTGCSVENMTLMGEMDGLNTIVKCSIAAITEVSGFFEKCAFLSSVTMNGSTSLFGCYDQADGDAYPVFNTGSNNLTAEDWHGDIGLTNMTGGETGLDVYGGKVWVDASCTGGTLCIRGDCYEYEVDAAATITIKDQRRTQDIAKAIMDYEI